LAERGVRDDGEPELEPGEIPGLARRHERDRPPGDRGVERGDRHVAVRGEDEVRVDLVRDDREPPGEAELRHAPELLATPRAPHRMVRVAEQEDARPGGDRALERVEVDFVAPALGPSERSEERRVGKECRAGWAW